jgi:hypothetical protein
VQQYQPNELTLCIAGLNSRRAMLGGEWQIREASDSEANNLRYDYRDFIAINCPFDHFTMHGTAHFHAKIAGKKRYVHKMQGSENIDLDSGVFLDFLILTCRADKYRKADNRASDRDARIAVKEDHFIALRCLFAGAKYDIATHIAENVPMAPITPGIHLPSEYIQGIVLVSDHATWPSPRDPSAPIGTIVSFRFPISQGRSHYKAFMVS